jgi:primosomal protein N' (replication factor Y)
MPEALTYASELPLQRGQSVYAPLGRGNRRTRGVVLGPAEPIEKTKPITEVEEEFPLLPEKFLQWLEWVADYYMYPVGLTTELAFPPLKKQTKERKSSRASVIPLTERDVKPELTPEQKKVVEDISQDPGFNAHLVFGVTGSGKTEVYLRLLEKVLEKGQTGIVLVPEISLTPQLIQRFARRFGDRIAALHSQLTPRERTNQWWDIVEGRKSILIGARSALFCPMPNLGLIIVDEEHEPSFKQEEKLKYHGRDSAVMLAKTLNIPIVLGSATPSLETWNNVLEKRYKLHTLKNRVGDRALPTVNIIDMRVEETDRPKELPSWISTPLFKEIQRTLDNGKQAALFLNRRGMSPLVLCPDCGHTMQCPNCDINLTLHAGEHLVCHYCDYHENFKLKCPDCREGEMASLGLGTELLETDLKKLFPEANVARADRDEIQNREELESLIEKMEKSEIDILVGTQMIAKGLDFPNLHLVGLVLADIGFNLPDFRSTERSFQLITQMSGRSGRHIEKNEGSGLVLIQAYNTEHLSLEFSQRHDFLGFAERELEHRRTFSYPPTGKMVSFRIQGLNQYAVKKTARALVERAEKLKQHYPQYQSLDILGPVQSPIPKLRNLYRYQVLFKGPQSKLLNLFSRQTLGSQEWLEKGTRIVVDVDPIAML